ncbi:hypothetical protein AUR64_06770 [Haloprofundus marisrubri]|uniref:Uncharacterized protein n=1 Tax=Haloprofundus marisrubri TaxID=1514971 RepID=A0A0W1RBT0_9EURY|nr:hypothetical protein [Haloprofundus marisrubri]KTG10880.1 hypothetical protein AUR64_06770 [Haloprofundus marisrubri]
MLRTALAGVGVLALVVVAGVGGALALGFTPADLAGVDGITDKVGDDASPDVKTDGGSDDTSAASDGGDGGDEAVQDAYDQPLRFSVGEIEECGTTCRDVTAEVRNTGNESIDDIDVEVHIFADDDEVWDGNVEVGSVDAAASQQETIRVELGYMDAYKIKQNDGYITVKTTVTTASGTFSFEERRKVA